jgi:hypothetical protein
MVKDVVKILPNKEKNKLGNWILVELVEIAKVVKKM